MLGRETRITSTVDFSELLYAYETTTCARTLAVRTKNLRKTKYGERLFLNISLFSGEACNREKKCSDFADGALVAALGGSLFRKIRLDVRYIEFVNDGKSPFT